MSGIEVKARTTLVTGSSRGIGRGVALKLAECGVARVTRPEDIQRMFAEARASLGSLQRPAERAGVLPARLRPRARALAPPA
jgi:NAD(P)-dependent dehydrogenase (short-subunit alcohol dehydrogenase family)